jgi:hypothetical protein
MIKAFAFQPSFEQGLCFSTIVQPKPLHFNHRMAKAFAFQPLYVQGPCFSSFQIDCQRFEQSDN